MFENGRGASSLDSFDTFDTPDALFTTSIPLLPTFVDWFTWHEGIHWTGNPIEIAPSCESGLRNLAHLCVLQLTTDLFVKPCEFRGSERQKSKSLYTKPLQISCHSYTFLRLNRPFSASESTSQNRILKRFLLMQRLLNVLWSPAKPKSGIE